MRATRLALVLTLTASFLAAGAGTASADTAMVTNAANSGPGSFRNAVQNASNNPAIDTIEIAPGVGPIVLNRGVEFTGTQASLRVLGNGASISDGGSSVKPLFAAGGGGNLHFQDLTLTGGSGFGVYITVPIAAGGDMRVTFDGVSVDANTLGGVRIDDSAGSAAGVVVEAVDSSFDDNGSSGIRASEAGPGQVSVHLWNVTLNGNFDGLDVDESDAGAVTVMGWHVWASRNSSDGFDLAENDGGSMTVDLTGVTLNDNNVDGAAIDEDDSGDSTVAIGDGQARRNGREGLDVDEDNTGHLNVTITNTRITGNDLEGATFREDFDGDLLASITGLISDRNGGDGLVLDEEWAGALGAYVGGGSLSDNGDDGLELRELRQQDAWVTVASVVTGNADFGVEATADAKGTQTLDVSGATFGGNGSGAVSVDAFWTLIV